jgi:hypothetical protein
MTTPLSDTSPEVAELLIRLQRELPPWRKLAQVEQMNATVRFLIIQGIRLRHPDADDTEIRRRFADIVLGQELAAKAFGPAPWAEQEQEEES